MSETTENMASEFVRGWGPIAELIGMKKAALTESYNRASRGSLIDLLIQIDPVRGGKNYAVPVALRCDLVDYMQSIRDGKVLQFATEFTARRAARDGAKTE